MSKENCGVRGFERRCFQRSRSRFRQSSLSGDWRSILSRISLISRLYFFDITDLTEPPLELYTSPVFGVKESLRMDATQTAKLPEEITPEKPRSWLKYAAAGVLALLVTVGLLFIPLDYTSFGDYWYLGVFLITLLASGGLIVQVPYLAAVVAAGTYIDPLQVGLLAGLA